MLYIARSGDPHSVAARTIHLVRRMLLTGADQSIWHASRPLYLVHTLYSSFYAAKLALFVTRQQHVRTDTIATQLRHYNCRQRHNTANWTVTLHHRHSSIITVPRNAAIYTSVSLYNTTIIFVKIRSAE